MAEAAETLENQTAVFNPELRFHDDLTTLMAEMVDGTMRTPFEYSFNGNELYGRDGRPLKVIFKDAIKDAEVIAAHKPNLAFELRRRWIEAGEYRDMLHMASGEGGNTMVVVSDFPPELMSAKENIGGYNVDRKQTMLRVITRQADGSLMMISQSLDGSNRQALEKLYESLGFTAEPGELLGQRLNFDLPEEDQSTLIDRLMGVYDNSMREQFGGNWHAGRSGEDLRNTYEFVCQQTDLLHEVSAMVQRDGQLSDKLTYNLAAALQKRFEKAKKPTFATEINSFVSIFLPPISPVIEMQHAGDQARASGKSFSGCGISLAGTTPGLGSTESELNESGYGNKTSEESDYKFDNYMHCVVCQAPPKKNESKRLCGPCGICRSCDKVLKSKM